MTEVRRLNTIARKKSAVWTVSMQQADARND
jgi:hypothetical protein